MPYRNGTYEEPANADRAAWARAALAGFAAQTRYSPGDRDLDSPETADEIAGDLLADLHHLLGEQRFAAALERSEIHFAAELDEENDRQEATPS